MPSATRVIRAENSKKAAKHTLTNCTQNGPCTLESSTPMPSTPRRTRFELSIELPIQREALKNYHNERSRVSAELRGLRTAIDLILTVANYGGEVTPNNRRMIESILA